jgi:hypothetical protein
MATRELLQTVVEVPPFRTATIQKLFSNPQERSSRAFPRGGTSMPAISE